MTVTFASKILVLLAIIFLQGATCQETHRFNLGNISASQPSRYHALGLFNNDHPIRKRIAVRKCPSYNFLYPLKIFSTEQPYFCPAAFVSTDSLLTSALCLKMLQQGNEHPSSHMFVIVDREDVFLYENGRRYVNKVFFHPKFEEEPAYYNIAIVKLRSSIRFDRDGTGRSHLACLWPEYRLKNANAVLGEWFEHQPEQNPAFRWLDLPFISQEECRTELAKAERPLLELNQGIRDFQVCVKDNRNNTMIQFCEPRSSGPLFMTLGNTVYLVGLPTVHIDDCGVEIEIFNRVYHFLDWIESVVWPGQE
ncbi:serine protease Hayan-like [Malaya genurostris]|uniref:serine protease Hayan-like n=1 Tax=Malaya genurostris TaxID=325434 RepID=UPI0026F3ED7F|nr:serine protease Hayan-like [Malaya genurostris]